MSAEPEIERKYLLARLPEMPRAVEVFEIDQGYLPGVRLVERLRRQRGLDGRVAYFRTVKVGTGVTRLELEEETTPEVFEHLWLLTEGRRLRKRRYVIPAGERYWEIDEFLDRTLVLAEMELEDADAPVDVPDWLRAVMVREVTTEKAYTNRTLAR